MSVYLFVPSVFGILLPYSTWAVATFGMFHSTKMGNLARDVLFRMPARDVIYVIHYSRSPALTNLMHGQVPATIPKLLWLTLLSICIHPNGWDHYLWLTKGHYSANCTWIMHVDTRIVCCDSYSFFSLKYQPRREGESCGKWNDH